MFKFLQSVPTPVALNSVHQAMRLLQHRIRPDVPRSKMVIKGSSSSPTPRELNVARKILKEIQQVEGRSIRTVEPRRVQKYVVTLGDLMQQRVKHESNFELGRAQSLLENLRKHDEARATKYLKRRKVSGKKAKAVVV